MIGRIYYIFATIPMEYINMPNKHLRTPLSLSLYLLNMCGQFYKTTVGAIPDVKALRQHAIVIVWFKFKLPNYAESRSTITRN